MVASRVENVLFRSLVALVALAPLPLGCVYPLAAALMAAAVAVLLVVHCVAVAAGRIEPGQRLTAIWPALVPFLFVAGWAALQGTSLTPSSWHHPLWSAAETALQTNIRGSVSINPAATYSALLRLLTYGAIFWLALQLARGPDRAQTIITTLAIFGIAYAVYGLVDKFSGADLVLWYRRTAYSGMVTSTFVNRNNYATYAGLGLLCVSGLLFKFMEEVASTRSLRMRVIAIIEAVGGWRWLLLPGWCLLLTALLLTGSRGGVLSTLAGLLAFTIATGARTATRRRRAWLTLGIIAIFGSLFVSLSGDLVGTRLADTTLEAEERPAVYELTKNGIARSPWIGTGYGTFAEAFRLERDARIHGFWDKAHDTYLENALELGIPAATSLTLALGVLLFRCLVGARRRRRNAVFPCIGVGATVLVVSHSLVDFGLQIPAIAATYALIMGAAVAQSWRTERPPSESGRADIRSVAAP